MAGPCNDSAQDSLVLSQTHSSEQIFQCIIATEAKDNAVSSYTLVQCKNYLFLEAKGTLIAWSQCSTSSASILHA